MPWKTILTVATFAGLMLLPQVTPALRNFKTFDPETIPLVWQMPVPKPPPEQPPVVRRAISIRQHTVPELSTNTDEEHASTSVIDSAHQMDHFYASLTKGGITRVLHYGDSPTTADLITADARALLQKQFGDAGSGFVLIARPWAWYGHRGVEMDASNWKIDVAGATDMKDGLHGLGAASFRGSSGAVAHWTLKDTQHSSVEISYLAQPNGGSFSMEADGVVIGTADTDGEQGPGYASFSFPSGSKNFTLKVIHGAVRLYGADFRKASPGVVYSSIGINGANVTLLSHALNAQQWTAELRHYKPDLIVVAFGTNESGFPAFVDGTWGRELRAAVRRIQAAVPGVSILLMSPMDRGERKSNGEIGTIEAMPRLVDMESKIAAETGVAFFNTFQAMGGAGTMAKWYNGEPRMVGADFIHPMPAGARIVGELLYNALREGYNEYKLRQLKEQETGLRDPEVESAGARSGDPPRTDEPQADVPKVSEPSKQ
jgi:lysophospholipase L1-like esterase